MPAVACVREWTFEAGPFQAGVIDPISRKQGFGAWSLSDLSSNRDPG